MSKRALYVTYDGLAEPLGKSQVLPYVFGLADRGHRFELLSFEKPGIKLTFREKIHENVRWTSLRYHKRPTVPATLLDMLSGLGAASAGALGGRFDVIHTRSYVPAALVLPLVEVGRIPLLFDMRGFWADEKVDAGTWPRDGRLYHGAKAVERALVTRADAITVLTHAMQRHFREEYPHRKSIKAPIHVIPTCTDLSRFTPDVPPDPDLARTLGDSSPLLYLGSIGTWYMSTEMARFYLAWRRHVPNPRLLVVSQQEPTEMAAVLAEAGVPASELVHRAADRTQVASFTRCARAALCFVRPSFSKRGSAPTKLGELLGCGVPVAANVVGDMATVLGESRAGVVVDDMSDEGLDRTARALAGLASESDIAQLARGDAERWFRLDQAIEAYDAIYRALPARHRGGRGQRDGAWPPG
jgi:glycosyltransferase involved in cell wall biosynthesis